MLARTYFQNLSTFRVPPQNIFEKLNKGRCSLSKPPCKSQAGSARCLEELINL